VCKLANDWSDVVRVRLVFSRSWSYCNCWSHGWNWCWHYWGRHRGCYRSSNRCCSHWRWSNRSCCNRCRNNWRLNYRSWSLDDRSCSRSRCSNGSTLANYGKNCANCYCLVLLNHDLLNDASYWRRYLGVYLVGGDLYQRLIDGNGVADLLEPAGDSSLGY
jgi:hypothetical protein